MGLRLAKATKKAHQENVQVTKGGKTKANSRKASTNSKVATRKGSI